MYDVDKLVSIVFDFFEAEEANKQYGLEVRKSKGYRRDAALWIPLLNGSEAFRLGELAERSRQTGWNLSTVCEMLDVDQERLISAVKSMQRWERSRWRWDCTVCLTGRAMEPADEVRFMRFISNKREENDYHPWYKSTGRKKAWCT